MGYQFADNIVPDFMAVNRYDQKEDCAEPEKEYCPNCDSEEVVDGICLDCGYPATNGKMD